MYALSSTGKSMVLLVVLCLTFHHPVFAATNDTLKEIDEIFDKIDKDHYKLRNLFEGVFMQNEQPPTIKRMEEMEQKHPAILLAASDCICVPLHLCNNDGYINKDGGTWLSARINDAGSAHTRDCENPLDVCCKEPIEKPLHKSTCGYSGNLTKIGIRENEETSLFGEFPWTVMILENSVKNIYACVGVLIHPQVVLTAAHCINMTKKYTARIGEWNTSVRTEPLPYESQEVQTIILHPQYNPNNLRYDAALLVLPKRFNLMDHINIACITECTSYNLKAVSDECAATGWGYDNVTKKFKRVMKRIKFSLMQHKQCEERFRTTTHLGKWFELHKSFLCAFGHHGFDLCAGDGGGPLVCPILESPNRYQLVGISSWSIGCAENNPAVFTKISEIKHWIDGWFTVFNFSKDYEYESIKSLY